MQEDIKYQDLFSGLIRLHVLHHASEHPIYGNWLIAELMNHGYRLGPGTIYPLLHSMEKKGYLLSSKENSGEKSRKIYHITDLGLEALSAARNKVNELHREMNEHKNKNRR